MATFKEGTSVLMTVLVLLAPSFTTARIDDYLNRHYTYESSENFGAVLSGLGLWYLRPLAPFWRPTDYLKKSGDVYTYHSLSPLYHLKDEFNLNEIKYTKTIDGRSITSIYRALGDTLHEQQEEENGRVTSISRAFTEDTLTIVIKVGNITGIRYHKFVEVEKKEQENKKNDQGEEDQ